MEKPLKQTVFIPVSVDDRTPDKDEIYLVIFDDDVESEAWFKDSNWYKWENNRHIKTNEVTHWLEKQEDKYILSESDLITFAKAMRKYDIDHAEFVAQAGNSVWLTGTVEDFVTEYLKK